MEEGFWPGIIFRLRKQAPWLCGGWQRREGADRDRSGVRHERRGRVGAGGGQTMPVPSATRTQTTEGYGANTEVNNVYAKDSVV